MISSTECMPTRTVSVTAGPVTCGPGPVHQGYSYPGWTFPSKRGALWGVGCGGETTVQA